MSFMFMSVFVLWFYVLARCVFMLVYVSCFKFVAHLGHKNRWHQMPKFYSSVRGEYAAYSRRY